MMAGRRTSTAPARFCMPHFPIWGLGAIRIREIQELKQGQPASATRRLSKNSDFCIYVCPVPPAYIQGAVGKETGTTHGAAYYPGQHPILVLAYRTMPGSPIVPRGVR